MRRGLWPVLFACVGALAGAARAGTVVYDGYATDGTSRAGGVTVETAELTDRGRFYEGYMTVSLEVDEVVYTLGTNLYSVLNRTSASPYAFTVDAAAGTITLTASDVGSLGALSLASVTLRFAESFSGRESLSRLMRFIADTPIVSVTATTGDGVIGGLTFDPTPPATPVPLTSAAWHWLLGLGAAVLARRRGHTATRARQARGARLALRPRMSA